MIGRVEGHRDGSRKERKGRKELNHEIHGIHGNGRARWSHRNPLSSVLRRPSFPLPREERRLTLLSYYCVTLTVSEGSDPKNTQSGRSQGAVRAQSPREACLVLLVGSELKRKEIADRVGMQSRSGYLSRLLAELVEDGLIERTIPDKPNSSQQRYRLTDKGRQVCSAHKG